MATVLTADDVDRIVIKAAEDRRHDTAATRLEELASQTRLHSPQVGPRRLLIEAGGQHSLAGDWDAAIRCYREAIVVGVDNEDEADDAHIDPRVWLHDALLRTGQLEEASAVLSELKAMRSRDPDFYAAVAESLEAQGLLTDAHTWFTMGYHRCERAHVPDFMMDLLLAGRRRIRARLGYPADDLDLLAEQLTAAVGD